MAVNRFLNVNWSQPISSFVPRPFEAAYMAGKQEQDQFDAGKQITGEIDTLSGAVKNTPNDEPAKQQMINEYRDAIKNTVDKYQGSFADPNFQYEAKNIINQFKNDKRLSIFATNLRRLDDFEKYAGDKNNKMDVFHNAKQWQKMNDPYNPKVYDPIAVTKYSNPSEQIAKYYDKIEEQGVDKSIVDMNPQQYGEGKWFLDRSGNIKFIKQDQLENIANANLSGYTGTEAGIWDLRRRIAGTNIEKQLAQAGITADQLDGTNYQQILGQLKLGQVDVPEVDAKGKPTGKTVKQDYTAADYINDGIKKDMIGYGTQFLHVVEDVDWKRTRAQFDDDLAFKKLEEGMVRFSTEGMGINPQTVEKSSAELNNNIINYNKSITELKDLMKTLPVNSPEWTRASSQVKWNEIQLKMREEMKADAEKAVNAKQTAADKKLFDLYGEWNPGDDSDPNSLRISNEMKAAGYKPEEYTRVTGQMRYLAKKANAREGFYTDQELLAQARALSGAYNRKNKSIDDYLKKTSKNYTLQPNLITVDNTKDLKTSKAIEDLYNKGVGSWEIYDENGPITDPELIPKALNIRQITENPVDKLGYLFSGTQEVKDEKGNIIETKKYYVRPSGEHNITEKIGKDLIDENKNKSTSQETSRYNMGLTMLSPQFATQVSEIRTNTNRDIQSGNKVIANVSKKETKAGTTYTITSPGYAAETFGSEEEVLNVLNNLGKLIK